MSNVSVPQVASLMYHEVTDNPLDTGLQRMSARAYTIDTATFGRHLESIGRSRGAPKRVDALDLAAPGRHLLLTFDDGGKSALKVGETLAARGWPAHFFIVTSWIGQRTFLSGPEIRALAAMGHVIGSHSHTHPDILPDLKRDAILAEWRTSQAIIEDLLGERCAIASIPGGDLSEAVSETAAETGFSHLFTSEPWLAPRRAGPTWLLGRVCVKAHFSIAQVASLAQFKGWRLARMERGLKWLARVGLSPVYRRYVGYVTRPA
jgi:peptidoglycan/xylan/chitin deacetylase (PgdA/CDA1 family)